MTEFEGVVEALGVALAKRGYSELTPVQQAVLDPKLIDKDLLVSAQTGSGKTVAFGIAIAPTLLQGDDKLARVKAPMALAVAPTRELALQVKRELEWLYESTGAICASCVGGMDMRTERRELARGAHIVVGTPGRLRDHIERGSLDMSEMRAIILDEADEMLDMGFRDDLEYILGAAPEERRTLMFSATVPRTIAALAKRYQRDAVRVSTKSEEKQHLDIEYRALMVAPNDRENAIVNVLRYFEPKNALVFCSTRATVNHMTSRFSNRGFAVVALSGELSQNERSHALQAMRDGRAQICIATDVAARGIDLPNLELVIHADIPKSKESLVHRSGRTGRAGRKGVCALIVPHNQRRRTESLLQRAKITAQWAKPPTIEEIIARDDERLLEDSSLSEEANEKEQILAAKLLSEHGAEQIAAAFVRLYRKEQTAPEELLDNAPMERGRGERSSRGRDDFANGVWFSMSIGRKQNAEPRWLLPMICRAGGITKRDIGAIRIDQSETSVEIDPKCVDRFLETLGPDRTVEKNIVINRMDGPPKGGRRAPPSREGKRKPYGDKKPYEGSKPQRRDQKDDFKKRAPKKEWDKKDRPRQDGPKKEVAPKDAAWVKEARKQRPASEEKPHAVSTHKAAPKADKPAQAKWDPRDSSAKGPGGKARRLKPAGSTGKPKGKDAAKKKSPSKLRRAAAREQLRLKGELPSNAGEAASRAEQVAKAGTDTRKRKKDD